QCYNAGLFWTSRFLLAPPEGYDGLVREWWDGSRTRHQVLCRFVLFLVNKGDDPHVTYEVAHLADSQRDGPAWTTEGGKAGLLHSGCTTMIYGPVPDENGIVQTGGHVPFVHELGHALGMRHSGFAHRTPRAVRAYQNGDTEARVTYGCGGPRADSNN